MSKQLTPAQETAKGLAEASELRMVTIMPHLLEEELTDKKLEAILDHESKGYTGIALSQYYAIGFIQALKKEHPAALLVFKKKRLIGDKRLDKILSRIEAILNIKHRVTWEIIEKPKYYAVSGTTGAASSTIYGTNGYVEVAFYLQPFQKPTIIERLHKQPRGYLKTTAKLVGKSTGAETTLFTMPPAISETGESLLREVISKNTAILGNLLFQLWQQSGKPSLEISNLSPISEQMGQTNYETKIYLLYLGGYTYPIIEKDENGLTLTQEQLFKVSFKYGAKVKEKHTRGEIQLVGTSLSQFIKDEPIEKIVVTPSELFVRAIQGKGLGNILAVDEKFTKLALSLTDIAYKIFAYSAANKPTQIIGEDKLIQHLGLEKQIKAQGRPRVRQTILKGFEELKEKEHIKSYSFDEARMMYSFAYSNKYVRHSKDKKQPE